MWAAVIREFLEFKKENLMECRSTICAGELRSLDLASDIVQLTILSSLFGFGKS